MAKRIATIFTAALLIAIFQVVGSTPVYAQTTFDEEAQQADEESGTDPQRRRGRGDR